MPAQDTFPVSPTALGSPAEHAAEVTPNDTTELAVVTRALYIGGAGDLKMTTFKDEDVTFKNVVAGTVLSVRAKLVFSTGTTATNIVALW